MLGRTPAEAFSSFIEPIQSALNTVSVGRLLLARSKHGVPPGEPLIIALNGGNPVPLRSPVAGLLHIEAALRVMIEPMEFSRFRFQCIQTGYWTGLLDKEHNEILAFHWTPDAVRNERSYPHLHIGRVVLRDDAAPLGRFHKLHILTGQLSLQHLVRLTIEEFNVSPRPGMNRATVLEGLNRTIGDR
jgi:hypothetical protein